MAESARDTGVIGRRQTMDLPIAIIWRDGFSRLFAGSNRRMSTFSRDRARQADGTTDSFERRSIVIRPDRELK